MTLSELTQIGENEFRVDFTTQVLSPITKTITVKGEIYTSTTPNTYTFDSKSDFYKNKKRGWHRLEIGDFKDISGQVFYVWNYMGLSTEPLTHLRWSDSTNGHVKLLYALVYGGYVKNVSGVFNYKEHSISKVELYANTIRRRSVDIVLYRYGFNNRISISVNFYKLLNTNFPDIVGTCYYNQVRCICDEIPELLPRKILTRITKIERNEIAINILNKSINFKNKRL